MDTSWILELLDKLNELLTNATGLTEEYTSVVGLFNDILTNFSDIIYGSTDMFTALGSLIKTVFGATLISAGLIILLISMIGSALTFIAIYLISAIPLTVIAKKAKCKGKWLAWVPVYQDLFCLILLYKIPGKDDFKFGFIKFAERHNSLLLYLLVYFLASALITVIFLIITVFPYIGQVLGVFIFLLYLLPTAIFTIIEFVYLRDVLNMFKPNKRFNCLVAWIVSILDNLITSGWARRIYLITLMSKKVQPLPEETPQLQAQQVEAEQPQALLEASVQE